MCGIAGLVLNHSSHNLRELINRMIEIQSHRGPDGKGIFYGPAANLALAHTRLAILDLSTGQQPMCNEDESIWIVFNGEIFNSPHLRQDLAHRHRFKTKNSDTEVLLHLYEEYGTDMLSRLNGMFAFVIYDKNKQLLFGARDRCGIKPLYFTSINSNFAFASELKAILTLSEIDNINLQSIWHYLTFQFVPAPETIIKGVNKLPAGHFFVYALKSKTMKITRYWEPAGDERNVLKGLSKNQILEQLDDLLKKAVSDWLLSDVPVGCLLSGGIDSASVVSIMSEIGLKEIKTWTLGFGDSYASKLDERPLAALIAKKYQTDHEEIVITVDDLLSDLEKMIYHLDEPYAGGLPSWYIFKGMAGQIKVAMTGTGGDELFGNYGKWKAYFPCFKTYWTRLLQRVKTQGLKEVFSHYHGSLYHGYFGEEEKKKIVAFDHQKIQSSTALIEKYWLNSGLKDPRDIVPYIDFQMQLAEEFLLMTDRFSMAWSIEARTPLLDHRLVEFVLSIPPDKRIRANDLKYLLKKVVKDRLPPQYFSAPKRGFVLPQAQWLRTKLRDVVEELLSPDYLKNQGIFSPEIYKRHVVPHMKGDKDYNWQLWTLLFFQLWFNVVKQKIKRSIY